MDKKRRHEKEEDDDIIYLPTSYKRRKSTNKGTLNSQTENYSQFSKDLPFEEVEDGIVLSPVHSLDDLRVLRRYSFEQISDNFNWELSYGVKTNNQTCYAYKDIERLKHRLGKVFKRFNKSIWNHLELNLQNNYTFQWKMRVQKLLLDEISKTYSNANLTPVGSTINGCGAYCCDMDLCLSISDVYGYFESDRSFALHSLRKISRLLEQLESIRKITLIRATVPILKLWFNEPYEHLEVDLNLNNIAGIHNSYLIHHYSRINDRFPTLALLIKNWAKNMNIADASQGTFNSYSLILMVLHFLQVASDPPILPNLQFLYPDYFDYNKPLTKMQLFDELPFPLPVPKNTKTVAELLIGFFKYYVDFDYEKYGISIARGSIFRRSELSYNMNRFKIFIEEPYDLQNTARCVTQEEQWQLIKEAFKKTLNEFFVNDSPSLEMLGISQD